MEVIDGGLHPAVDGQSLDEDEDEDSPLDKMIFPYERSSFVDQIHDTPSWFSLLSRLLLDRSKESHMVETSIKHGKLSTTFNKTCLKSYLKQS